MKSIEIYGFTFFNWLPWEISVLIPINSWFKIHTFSYKNDRGITVINFYFGQLDIRKNFCNRIRTYYEDKYLWKCKRTGNLWYLFFPEHFNSHFIMMFRGEDKDCNCNKCD